MSPSQHDADPTATASPPRAMTALGPVDDLGIVLMNEKVICDSRKRPQDRGGGGGALSWNDLAFVREKPFQSATNMTLSSKNDAIEELTKAQHSFDTILDTTSVGMGRDPVACKLLSEQLQKHIILGTTPTTDADDMTSSTTNADQIEASKDDIDRMEQELLYGYNNDGKDEMQQQQPPIIRAGFIGELQLSNPMTPTELRQLKTCAVVQSSTKAPLLVHIQGMHQICNVVEKLEACGADLSRLVLTHMDLYGRSDIPRLVELVLKRGINICFDQFSLSCAIWDLDRDYPSRQNVVEMVQCLLQDNPAYGSQILLSNGISMKLQYTKYGGLGYNAVAHHLIPKLQRVITQVQIDAMVRENPRRLLCWWTPPPPKVRPKEFLPCSICKKMFEPIVGEYFTKFAFTYCGTKCLRRHRKMGFKELSS